MNARQLFDRAYARTVKAMNASLDPGHADECWKVVELQRGDVFDEAATRLNSMCQFLPRPAEWLAACKAIQAERDLARIRARQAEYDAHTDHTTYCCHLCKDTGFERRVCPEPPNADWCPICKRQNHHLYDHTYVVPCACRPTNEAYQKRLDRQKEVRLKHQQANERSHKRDAD